MIFSLEIFDEFSPGILACLQQFPSVELFSVEYLVRGDRAAPIQVI